MGLDNDAVWALHMYTSRTKATHVVSLDEPVIHALVHHEITIGRALNNDVVVLDPVVSREHARLVWNQSGWYITNVTKNNIVRVCGRSIPAGTSFPIDAQDICVLGNTVLQLIDQRSIQPDSLKKQSPKMSLRQAALPTSKGTQRKLRITTIGGVALFLGSVVLLFLGGLLNRSLLTSGRASTLVIALAISLITAGAIFILINFINRFEPKPLFLCLAAFLWGAVIAAPLAFFLESSINLLEPSVLGQRASEIGAFALQSFNPGIVEESSKGLGLLLLFFVRRDEFDNVIDGIVYGILIGAGFTVVENFWYFTYYSNVSLTVLIIERVLLGWLLHSTFTACMGIALGYMRHIRVGWKQILLLSGGFLLAVGLHSLFDFVALLSNVFVLTSPEDKRVVLFMFLALFGNYVPPYVVQIVIMSIVVKVMSMRAENSRENSLFEDLQLVATYQLHAPASKKPDR